jgi:hypothetical protein
VLKPLSAQVRGAPRGRVTADLACAIADGSEVISGFRVLADDGAPALTADQPLCPRVCPHGRYAMRARFTFAEKTSMTQGDQQDRLICANDLHRPPCSSMVRRRSSVGSGSYPLGQPGGYPFRVFLVLHSEQSALRT